jgi:hypothetical protein
MNRTNSYLLGVLLVLIVFALVILFVKQNYQIHQVNDTNQRNEAVFKACIDAGGVPLQSWFNSKVVGDCKFPAKEKE